MPLKSTAQILLQVSEDMKFDILSEKLKLLQNENVLMFAVATGEILIIKCSFYIAIQVRKLKNTLFEARCCNSHCQCIQNYTWESNNFCNIRLGIRYPSGSISYPQNHLETLELTV